jgi:hypothetical protein
MKVQILRTCRNVTGLIIAGALLILVHNFFSPPDWVRVKLHRLPDNVRSVFVIAENNDQIRALNWYHSKIVCFTDDPKITGQEWLPQVRGPNREGDLQWVDAKRFGVLAKDVKGRWMLWWLDSEDISGPSVFRYIVGGGQAEIRVPDTRNAQFPQIEFVNRINVPQ